MWWSFRVESGLQRCVPKWELGSILCTYLFQGRTLGRVIEGVINRVARLVPTRSGGNTYSSGGICV